MSENQEVKPKVGIVIVTYNIPAEVFLLQIEAIRKFCKDDFEIVIIENSDNKQMSEDLKYHASVLGLQVIKTLASSGNGTESHAFAANTSYQILRDKYDHFFYIDHDCIPVKDFSVVEILTDKVMAGLGQGTWTKYFWAGCVMWDNRSIDRSLINFSPNTRLKIDTGGELRKVIDTYGEDKCVFFNELYKQNPNFTQGMYNYYAMLNNEMFMHFVNSSNWNPVENNKDRLNSLINIAREWIT